MGPAFYASARMRAMSLRKSLEVCIGEGFSYDLMLVLIDDVAWPISLDHLGVNFTTVKHGHDLSQIRNVFGRGVFQPLSPHP